MSRGDIIGGAAVPLTDALPWESALASGSSRTFLVNDSIGTDGRFLLYTLASQVLLSSGAAAATDSSSRKNRGCVLWLGCGPVTEGQILQGLKKIGCDKTALSQAAALSSNGTTTTNSESPLNIRSLVTELSTKLLQSDDGSFNEHDFVKELYQFITQAWLGPTSTVEGSDDSANTNNWIILDDVSALSNLLGEKLVFSLVLALNAKSHQSNKFGLVLRCSNDHETESLPSFAGSSVTSSGPEWFGAGGATPQNNYNNDTVIPWERSLIELADGVMDVVPLTSGYTRELHGRIVLTQMPQGRGWGDESTSTSASNRLGRSKQQKQHSSMQIINYCITDQKIVAYII